MLQLTKIELDGYKSIRQSRELTLGALNLLIGANGSGKSNFLSFFKLLNFAMTGALQEFIGRAGGANALLHFGAKKTPHLSATLQCESDKGTNTYRMKLAHAAPDTLVFVEEVIQSQDRHQQGHPTLRFFGAGHRESALIRADLANEPIVTWFAQALSRFPFYQFHDTSDESRWRGRCDMREDRQLLSNGGNLAAWLRVIREQDASAYQRIRETIQLVFPFFRDFSLDPADTRDGHIMLRWRAIGSAEYEFGPHQLSDGTLRFMALATLLLQPRLPSLITIDEPELGLHPFAIKVLASLLAEASERSQIIVATQSPALVDEVEPGQIIVADAEAGVTQLRRLDEDKLQAWLADYKLSELWDSNAIGGRP